MRSLADDLRGRTDAELAELLRARPDLGHPVALNIGALAQRAASLPSVASLLRGYDELHLQILLICALAEEPLAAGPAVTTLVEAGEGELSLTDARAIVRSAWDDFRSDAVLWGTPRRLHVAGAARELLVPLATGPLVAGIDRTVAGYVDEPGSLAALAAEMPPAAQAAFARLLARPVVGTVVNPRRDPDPARSGVDWLLAHHFVVPFGADRVVVPGEVVRLAETAPAPLDAPGGPGRGSAGKQAWQAGERQTRPGGAGAGGLRVPRLVPPQPTTWVTDPHRAESGAVGAIVDVLHAVEELGHLWAEEPPARLRAGGVAVRDVTRAARQVGTTEPVMSLLIEVAAAAGLLANENREMSTVLPTAGFDVWAAARPAIRMAQLLIAWRDMPRAVGVTTGEGTRPLGDQLTAPHLPVLRGEVLAALAEEADGAWSTPEVLDALRWRAPRLDWGAREPHVLEALGQMRTLGILVGGWLTPAGRTLVPRMRRTRSHAAGVMPTPDPRDAHDAELGQLSDALDHTLPAQVDSVIVQGDLTAIVPGLATPELADLLRRTAQTESRGVATVYRFTPDTIRAALDSGSTATELLTELGRYGAVPQPLAYLIGDTARTHAGLRVGTATTYLRSDDPAVLAGILGDPRTGGLGLYALSPTVAASELPPEQVLEQLRSLGHHPMADPGRGLAPRPVRRARSRTTMEPPAPGMTPTLAAAAVRVMRAGDAAEAVDADGPGGPGPARRGGFGSPADATSGAEGADPAQTSPDARSRGVASGGLGSRSRGAVDQVPGDALLGALREAIAEESEVLLDYATSSGVTSLVRVQPLRLAGGYLTALDPLAQAIGTYSVARIGALHPVDGAR